MLLLIKTGPILALSAYMKTVIIVSKCLRVIKFNSTESWYEFHFKGVCAGESLKKVLLLGRHNFHISKGTEYLMYIQMLFCEKGILKGKILKLRRLDECWDRS
jgi:hypothetical protein